MAAVLLTATAAYEKENVMNQQLEEYQNQSAVVFKNAAVWRRGQDGVGGQA